MSLSRKALPILALPVLLLASCAGDGGGDSATGRPAKSSSSSDTGFKPISERMADTIAGRDGGYTKDADGNFLPTSNKRSSFELNRDSPHFKGDYAKKNFKTNDYAKKSWWGDTQHERKKFGGDTDGSRFQTSSRFQGAGAREANTSAKLPGAYRTNQYGTSTAREAGGSRLGKPSDAETDVRRRVYTPPAVVDWKEQRSMSMGETKSFLGR
ncbi:hypothetical protein OVA24_06445 [Luteolibacter sp. SL250]|uniref:hypothetical protein n=1 Tax=Luteolibacter sp. SL250 TaxID=2995170 RepID=UPI00226FA626|nr:hypothetical protein [Luteolibacter sp. SL250]WAC21021.1 hypothetical protein OVA24_06445 [Luteolibacter sp. SL250]